MPIQNLNPYSHYSHDHSCPTAPAPQHSFCYLHLHCTAEEAHHSCTALHCVGGQSACGLHLTRPIAESMCFRWDAFLSSLITHTDTWFSRSRCIPFMWFAQNEWQCGHWDDFLQVFHATHFTFLFLCALSCILSSDRIVCTGMNKLSCTPLFTMCLHREGGSCYRSWCYWCFETVSSAWWAMMNHGGTWQWEPALQSLDIHIASKQSSDAPGKHLCHVGCNNYDRYIWRLPGLESNVHKRPTWWNGLSSKSVICSLDIVSLTKDRDKIYNENCVGKSF